MTCALASMGTSVDMSKYPDGLDAATVATINSLLINITNANTDALASAVDNMQFNNIDQVGETAINFRMDLQKFSNFHKNFIES
jgi:hypothetical protein